MTSTDTHTWTSSESRWWNCSCGYATPDQAEAQAHTAETSTIITVPAKHALDWFGRYDGDDATEAAHTARTVTLVLGSEALLDLISDAHYYAAEMGRDNTGDIDYRPAARALIRGLARAGVTYTISNSRVRLTA